MSELSSKNDMLASAKKKLKEYEERRKASVEYNYSNCTSSNGQDNGESFENDNKWKNDYFKLKSQHDELCSHYSQLYTSYSQLSSDPSCMDAKGQIIQLQAALSSTVEEKLTYQKELRKANEKIQKLEKEKESQAIEDIDEPNVDDTFDVKRLRNLIDEQNDLLTKRQNELDVQRTEISKLQSVILNEQHEKSEAQAKMKRIINENKSMEDKLKQMKNEIHMKNLLLKQNQTDNKNGHNVPSNDEDNKELNCLKEENSRLINEINYLKSHYSQREEAFIEVQSEQSKELEEIRNEKSRLLDKINNLEYKLNGSVEVEEIQKINVDEERESPKSEASFDHCDQNKFECERSNVEEEELTNFDEQNNILIIEKDNQLKELNEKCISLENRVHELTTNRLDILQLSEQLQNEKSTVSRAVAQNKELKVQLIDVEDRLIKLTEEKLQIELEKQSAQHQVQELEKRLINLNNNNTNEIKKDDINKDNTTIQEELLTINRKLKTELDQLKLEMEKVNNQQMENKVDIKNIDSVLEEQPETTVDVVLEHNDNNNVSANNSNCFNKLLETEQRLIESNRNVDELRKTKENLEHINQQLQLENETIADYIVMYQHHRKVIRDRLRLKDQQLNAAKLEMEKIMSSCRKLENKLSILMKNKSGHDTIKRRHSCSLDTISSCKTDSLTESLVLSLKRNDESIENSIQCILETICDIKSSNMESTNAHCMQCIGEIKHI